MLQLFLIIWVSRKRVYPLAKANGKSVFGWVSLTVFVWLAVEVFVFLIFELLSFIFEALFGFNSKSNSYIYFSAYIVAVVCGALSAGYICEHLEKAKQSFPDPPLPPKNFSDSYFGSPQQRENN